MRNTVSNLLNPYVLTVLFSIPYQEPAPTSSKKTVPEASPKSSSPEKKSSSTETTLTKDIPKETTPSTSQKIAVSETTTKVKEVQTPATPTKTIQTPAPPTKTIQTPAPLITKVPNPPVSQPPSASKTPLSTLSKVITDDAIVIPKKRGRPSTVKTEPETEKVEEKVEKVEVVEETYVNNENFLKKVRGRKGKFGRKVSKLLEDVEQLLDYQVNS
jgi:hypothetical protein